MTAPRLHFEEIAASRATAPRPLRVGHVLWSLCVGGMEKLVLELSVRSRPHGIEPVILATGPDGPLREAFAARGVRVHFLGDRRGLSPGLLLRLADVCRSERLDLLHAHDFGQWLNALLPAVPLGIPLAATFHTPVRVSRLQHLPARVAAAASAALVACGDEVRSAIGTWAPAGTRIETIGNGVATVSHAPAARATLRKRLGIPDAAAAIGFLGRLNEENGVDRLLKLFLRRYRGRPDVHLVLVGPGELFEPLSRVAEGEPNVHLTGEVADGAALLGALDIYCQPSFREGRSLALLEAMACGLPSVSTTLPSIRELHVEGETALLVTPGDDGALDGALRTLVEAPPLRERMGAAAARAVGRFSIERTVEEYAALYRSLVRR